jgi:glutaredoxin
MPGEWWRFWRRRTLKGVRVVVWTRADCPLCDEAAAFLEAERRKLGFQLDYVDVDADPAHRERYGDSVPVIEVNGEVRFRGHINRVLWNRLVVALSTHKDSEDRS